MTESRWLRTANGSPCILDKLGNSNQGNGVVYGPMDLVSNEEDDPIALLEDVEIHDNECGDTWRLTGFYGHPDERNRSASWDLLRQISHDQTIHWVVVGDFNEITNSFEKEGRRLRSERQMKEFREALKDCNLTD
ncbi:hypothetical protein Goari_020740, partial [Gossypium aridum]|nr:hypothetical protein [Gossypium aridum]